MRIGRGLSATGLGRGLLGADDASPQRTFSLVAGSIIGFYLLFAGALYLWRGIYFTPDLPDSWAIVLFAGALALGRWKSFLREWIPFVALIFGYELLRGFAGHAIDEQTLVPSHPGAVHWNWLLSADRWLGLGEPLTLRLQDALYTPGVTKWWDLLATAMYSLHFALPIVVAFILWVRDQALFRRFTVTLLFATYSTFIVFLLYPTAPPWLVNFWGRFPGISDPFDQAATAIGTHQNTDIATLTIWTHASPDVVAAFPSLHTVYPWLVLLFLVRFFGKRGWLFLLYNAAVWFAIVYLAQHWVVDILGGIVWATASYLLVDFVLTRIETRRTARPAVAAEGGE